MGTASLYRVGGQLWIQGGLNGAGFKNSCDVVKGEEEENERKIISMVERK